MLIAIDGISDGLTMGISESIGVTQGLIMALSLCVEMAFTGAALAGILLEKKTPRVQSIWTLSLVPFCMLIGGVIGRLIMHSISEQDPIFAGVIAFTVGQLYYLGAVDLISDAFATLARIKRRYASECFDLAMMAGFLAEVVVKLYLPT